MANPDQRAARLLFCLLLATSACSSSQGFSQGDGGQSNTNSQSTGGGPASGGTTNGGSSPGGSSNGATGNSGDSGVGGSSVGGSSGGGSSGGTDATANSGGYHPGSGGAPPDDVTPSSGCDRPGTLTTGKHTLRVNDEEREYIISIPSGALDNPLPLVFGFHGMRYDAEWVAEGQEPLTGPYFGMESEAQGKAIFVAGQALPSGWSNQDGRDIDYVTALVEELSAQLCIDRSRIFATGFSAGGIMTATIGCELYDVFRAVSPQSASLPSVCSDDLPPLSYLGIHGTEDTTIRLAQGEGVRDHYAARNGCSTPSSTDENGCFAYEDCDGGNATKWCTFAGEHVPAPFTGPVLWDFFSQF